MAELRREFTDMADARAYQAECGPIPIGEKFKIGEYWVIQVGDQFWMDDD